MYICTVAYKCIHLNTNVYKCINMYFFIKKNLTSDFFMIPCDSLGKDKISQYGRKVSRIFPNKLLCPVYKIFAHPIKMCGGER